jgi:prefoldin subunit 5
MARALVTRRVLARELAIHAATRPLNIGVPVAVAACALLLAWWLLPVALVVYGALVVATFLDGEVAESVGRDVYARARSELPRRAVAELSSGVAARLSMAYEAEERIRHAVDESGVPLADVQAEVDRLMEELEKMARQADRLTAYLADDDEGALQRRLARLRRTSTGDPQVDHANAQAAAALQDQLDTRTQLERRLSQFDAQMEHIVATLGVVHAQIVRIGVEEEAAAQGRVAKQVRSLRHEVGAVADALRDASRELD